jgi:hypothetical protein
MTLLDQEVQTPPKHHYRGIAIAVTFLLAAVLALGGYLLRLKHNAERMRAHATESQPLPPPVSGPQQQVPIFVPADAEGTLHRAEISVAMPAERGERARQVLRSLIGACMKDGSTHPMPPGSDVQTVYLVGDNLAVVDLNSNLVNAHASGILVEELTIASMSETMAANVPGIKRVKFLVDGKERDTLAGHVSLKVEYEVAALSAFLPANANSRPER